MSQANVIRTWAAFLSDLNPQLPQARQVLMCSPSVSSTSPLLMPLVSSIFYHIICLEMNPLSFIRGILFFSSYFSVIYWRLSSYLASSFYIASSLPFQVLTSTQISVNCYHPLFGETLNWLPPSMLEPVWYTGSALRQKSSSEKLCSDRCRLLSGTESGWSCIHMRKKVAMDRREVGSVAQSRLTLETPWTAAHQASLSITNSRS